MKKTFLVGVVVGALALNTFGLFASEGEEVVNTIPNSTMTQAIEISKTNETNEINEDKNFNNFYNRCGIDCPKEEPCVGDCTQDKECVESGCMGEGCGQGNSGYNCNVENGKNEDDQRNGYRSGYRNGQMRRRGC